MTKLYCYFLFLSGVLTVNAKLSFNDLKQKYIEIIIECSRDYPISADNMAQLRQKIMPDDEKTQCLFACVYRNAGMMDGQGKLSVDGVNTMTRSYLSDDPEKLKKSEEFTELCKSVNDVEVSDGDKGCERAALIFKCTVEKAPDFEFL